MKGTGKHLYKRTAKKWNLADYRKVAIQTARSIIRNQGLEMNPEVAIQVLDDLYRTDKQALACVWYRKATSIYASDNQMNLFKREFKKGMVN